MGNGVPKAKYQPQCEALTQAGVIGATIAATGILITLGVIATIQPEKINLCDDGGIKDTVYRGDCGSFSCPVEGSLLVCVIDPKKAACPPSICGNVSLIIDTLAQATAKAIKGSEDNGTSIGIVVTFAIALAIAYLVYKNKKNNLAHTFAVHGDKDLDEELATSFTDNDDEEAPAPT